MFRFLSGLVEVTFTALHELQGFTYKIFLGNMISSGIQLTKDFVTITAFPPLPDSVLYTVKKPPPLYTIAPLYFL